MTPVERLVAAGIRPDCAAESVMWYQAQGDDYGLQKYLDEVEARKEALDNGRISYTYPAYGGYNPVTPFAPAPQIYQPMQQPSPQPVQAAQTVGNTNTQPNFFCRPVASREEALGVPVDFMGAPMFFPDLAHNVVYMKRFNTNSGAADVFEFKLDVPREKQEQAPAQVAAFAPLDEFIDMKDTVQNLKDELDRLKKPAGKAVKKNDASDE